MLRTAQYKHQVEGLIEQIDLAGLKNDDHEALGELLAKVENCFIVNQKKLTKNKKLRSSLSSSYKDGLKLKTVQFSAIAQQIFHEIEECDNTKTDERAHITHRLCANFFDHIANQLATELLDSEDIDLRTLIFEAWIQMMQLAFNLGDLLTAAAIFFGLSHSAIDRLKATQLGISDEAKKTWEEIGNYLTQYMHEIIENESKPIIPVLSYFTQRFLQCESKIQDLQLKNESSHQQDDTAAIDEKLKISLAAKDEIKDLFLSLQKQSIKGLPKPNLILLEEMTKDFSETQKNRDAAFYAKSVKCEEKDKVIEPSTILQKIPELSLVAETPQFDKKVVLSIQRKQIKQTIIHINAEISALFSNLIAYTKQQEEDSKKVRHTKLQAEHIIEQFQFVIKHVGDSAKNGPLPDIFHLLALVNQQIKDHKNGLGYFYRNKNPVKQFLEDFADFLKQEKEQIAKLEALKIELQSNSNQQTDDQMQSGPSSIANKKIRQRILSAGRALNVEMSSSQFINRSLPRDVSPEIAKQVTQLDQKSRKDLRFQTVAVKQTSAKRVNSLVSLFNNKKLIIVDEQASITYNNYYVKG